MLHPAVSMLQIGEGNGMTQPKCEACQDGAVQPLPFSMAFQPIVNVDSERVYAYEALVRGPNGESAASVLRQVTEANRYAFDQNCRVKAITLAAQLGLAETGAMLSINFMPGAVYSPAACIQLTLKTASKVGFPSERLIFEITEGEKIHDQAHLASIAEDYRRRGFKMALDDFGSGYSELNLLANLPIDILKLDMDLTRNIDRRRTTQTIVHHLVRLAADLGIAIVAEGIETWAEYETLRHLGIRLMQGYLFAKPAFEALPPVSMPVSTQAQAC
jgi:EAL domain-containing protein (putative c-di-GMP-specific phosphodiesterase class I)